MTRIYHYIECGKCLDETAHIYYVAIGTSKQGQRDYLALVAFSVDYGHYFQIRSLPSSEFLKRVQRAHGIPDSSCVRVSARDLVRHLKSGLAIVAPGQQLVNAERQRRILDSAYHALSKINARRASGQSER